MFLTQDLDGIHAHELQASAQLLFREAEILDAGLLNEWLLMVAPEVDYRVLNRVTRDRGTRQEAFDPNNFLLQCDRLALEARVARQNSDFAWAEETPVTTRRFISNVRARRSGDGFCIKSNLLLFRARWDESAFVSAERIDQWLPGTSGPCLTKRWVYLDHTILPIENLSVFL